MNGRMMKLDLTKPTAPALSHSLPVDSPPPFPGKQEPPTLPESCWVLTTHKPPFTIIATSDSWHKLWKFTKEETIGGSINILQGEGTNVVAAKALMARQKADGISATARCTNPMKCGELMSHDLLLTAPGCGLLLGISCNITPTQELSDEQRAQDAQAVPAVPAKLLVQEALRDVTAQRREQAEAHHAWIQQLFGPKVRAH